MTKSRTRQHQKREQVPGMGLLGSGEHARRTNEACRRFYERKLRQTNTKVAHNALAHKLARAAYYIMKDHVSYQEEKMFS